ncbi:MAG: metallophosphoesterase, partial [Phycisphaerae bacterium]|nr:metallophosphoesterase [Phycisphaerae bacterium]
MAVRLLHIADTHIGAGWPRRRPARDARPYRGDDFARAYQRVVERAREHNVDLVIHAGDLFDHPRPTQAHVAEACQPLLRLAQEGVPVVIVPGNHERSALPACLWLAHENIHIMAEPRTVLLNCRGVRVAVSGFPCVRRGAAAQFDDNLRATGWSRTRAEVHILAVHQTFRGARCGPADYVFRGGDDVIDAISLEADGMQLVLNGGLGDDVLIGSEGNDLINGGDGDDLALMGAGDDVFVWNPGDDNDTLEGQDGFDRMVFNGSNAAENIDIFANGGRVIFFRDVANVLMDLNDVEGIDFNALGGADTVVVHDLSGTDVAEVNLNLAGGNGAGDAQPDTVIVQGTANDDVILAFGDASGTAVLGLAAQVNITG